MLFVSLILVSFASWFFSTITGGGSPLVLIPLVSCLLGSQAVAPVITTGMLLGNSQRILLFWQQINWSVTFWFLPGAIVGAVLGAYALTQIHAEWLQLVIGAFLVISVISFGLSKDNQTFNVQAWQFLPAAFFYAFISGLIGSSGPIMNPMYLNYGLQKEQMVATKATNVVVIHIVKMIAYSLFGALNVHYLGYGLMIGLAAAPANWVGQYVLRKMSERSFQQLVLATMMLTGVVMLWEQRDLMMFW